MGRRGIFPLGFAPTRFCMGICRVYCEFLFLFLFPERLCYIIVPRYCLSLLINNCHPIIFDPTQFLHARGLPMYIQSNLFACQFLVFRPPFDLNAGGPSCTYTFSNSGCHALILGIIRSYRRRGWYIYTSIFYNFRHHSIL